MDVDQRLNNMLLQHRLSLVPDPRTELKQMIGEMHWGQGLSTGSIAAKLSADYGGTFTTAAVNKCVAELKQDIIAREQQQDGR